MKLIRKYGADYGRHLDNPGRSLREVESRTQLRKDMKVMKKWFSTLDNLADDMDLEPQEKAALFKICASRFEMLPEAQYLLTFLPSTETVKENGLTVSGDDVNCEHEELTESSVSVNSTEPLTVSQSNEVVNNFAGNPSAEQIKSLFNRLVKVNSAYFSDTKEGRDFYAKKLRDPDSGYEGLLAYVDAEEQRLSPARRVMAAGGM
jgi:hypothetical protein